MNFVLMIEFWLTLFIGVVVKIDCCDEILSTVNEAWLLEFTAAVVIELVDVIGSVKFSNVSGVKLFSSLIATGSLLVVGAESWFFLFLRVAGAYLDLAETISGSNSPLMPKLSLLPSWNFLFNLLLIKS